MWARGLSVAIGLWLMAVPAVLDYGDPARTVDRIVGPLVTSAAVIAMWEVVRAMRWLETLAGLVLIALPALLAYPLPAAINSVLAGLVLVVVGIQGGQIAQRFGGGWRTLWYR